MALFLFSEVCINWLVKSNYTGDERWVLSNGFLMIIANFQKKNERKGGGSKSSLSKKGLDLVKR